MLRSDSVGERRRLGDDDLLNRLDALAQHGAEDGEQRHGEHERRRDRPVRLERVHHDEDDADERGEHHVHERGDEPLGVGPHLLQLAERLTAPLILERLEGERERVTDAVGVEVGADALHDDVDEVVLEVLRDA
jgi:hypothetical protein